MITNIYKILYDMKNKAKLV